jgi:hypothetical protein
MDVNTEMED